MTDDKTSKDAEVEEPTGDAGEPEVADTEASDTEADAVVPAAEASADAPAETGGEDDATAEAADGAPEPEIETGTGPLATTPEERDRDQRQERHARGESRPVRAVARYLRFSAQKGRLVVDQIRGKRVGDAAALLQFSTRGASEQVGKALRSAVANAVTNHGHSADELYVAAAWVDEGPTFKRWKPRARGRVDRVFKRTCHVTVVVDVAPATLLEGRAGRSGRGGTTRAARVAASKSPSGAATRGTASKSKSKSKTTGRKKPAGTRATSAGSTSEGKG